MRPYLGFLLAGTLAAGCAEDPQYITPGPGTSFSMEFNSDDEEPPAPVAVVLPFRLETEQEAMERAELGAELMFDPEQIPLVTLDAVDLSIEWSIKNLSECDAQATFSINGGNQYFAYDPTVFVVDPEEDEPPPPLLGNMAPINVPASAVVTGVFREDQIREAAIDLDLITRAFYNPFRALLMVHKNIEEMEILTEVDISDEEAPPQTGTGMFIPPEAWAQLVQFSIAFAGEDNDPDEGCGGAHLVLEWTFRARDHRGLVHDEGMDADPAELTAFAPVPYAPPGAVTE
jgi:hypothetical protein